jgi:bifunctional oligoribonuclease and PAP phosphatase NrnA
MLDRSEGIEEELGGAQAAQLVGEMRGRILAAREILVTSHHHPDGDAFGSTLALALVLRRLGKSVRAASDHSPPQRYRSFDPAGLVRFWEDKPPPETFRGVDLGILLDASEPSRAGCLADWIGGGEMEWICLDHHPGPQSPVFAHHWVAPRAPATGSLVLRLADFLGVEPDRAMATALFVAIATDTGWFRFSNTSPLCLRDAARLIAAGAEPEELFSRIYEDHSPERMALLGRIFSGLKLELDGRYVWSAIDRPTLESSGVPREELDGFVEAFRAVRGAQVVALIVEVEPNEFKVSLRARGGAAVDGIAVSFGGGGHAKAAGFRRIGDLKDLLRRLRSKVEETLVRVDSRQSTVDR